METEKACFELLIVWYRFEIVTRSESNNSNMELCNLEVCAHEHDWFNISSVIIIPFDIR